MCLTRLIFAPVLSNKVYVGTDFVDINDRRLGLVVVNQLALRIILQGSSLYLCFFSQVALCMFAALDHATNTANFSKHV